MHSRIAPAPREYEVLTPPGMLADGLQVKRFTSVSAFDGYVAYLRRCGYGLTFASPLVCIVSPR